MQLNDFNMVWIKTCSYPQGKAVRKHEHDFFHYIYVLDGTGTITIGEKSYTIRPGYIYLTDPRVEHGFICDESGNLVTIEIKFYVSDQEMYNKFLDMPRRINVKTSPIETILTTINDEYLSKRNFYESIIECELHELFMYLSRLSIYKQKKSNTVTYSHSDSSIIDTVIRYIYDNIDKNLSLSELAKVAALEKTYFMKKFKKQTNQTPMNYIRRVRMEQAKDLLLYSDMNITQVALSVGFNSIHHFSNVFQKHFGLRPNECKKSK